jgi:hypothetical protein
MRISNLYIILNKNYISILFFQNGFIIFFLLLMQNYSLNFFWN